MKPGESYRPSAMRVRVRMRVRVSYRPSTIIFASVLDVMVEFALDLVFAFVLELVFGVNS